MLSIIVPVYNVEQYLERCVKSLLAQDLNEYEILLIDDGSTDTSGMMCDELSALSSKIRVIHKTNGGLSDTRNVGIDNACGDYMMFIDSDDSVRPNTIRQVYETAQMNNLDALSFSIDRIKDGESEIVNSMGIEVDKVYTGCEFLTCELVSGTFKAMAQKKIYRSKLLKDKKLYFKKGIYHEDEEWSPRFLLVAERVMQTDIVVYEYYIREGSITTNPKTLVKRSKDVMAFVAEHQQMYKEQSEPLKSLGLSYTANLYMLSASNVYLVGEKLTWKFKYIKHFHKGIEGVLRKILFVVSPSLYCKLRNSK